jgi:nicotinamidase-related amidase
MQRLEPKSTLVLVVDIQEKLAPAMDKDALARLLRGTDVLLLAAKLLGLSTIATEQYPKGLGPTVPQVLAGLEQVRAARVSKTCFSAMDQPEVARFVAGAAPRAVVVVGMESHVCILQTVRDLLARGYEVHVPHDGVASRREDDRRVALDLLAREGAIVTSVETVVFDLLQKAEGDAFKELSKKIR